MSETYDGIVIEIKGAPQAVREIGAVDNALAEAESQARALGSEAAKALSQIQSGGGKAKAVTSEQAAASKAAAEAARQQKAAQAQLAAAYRAIIGPAADYNRKLAEAVQLERQGAISAQQRANYIRGLQREMKQFSAQQQGGVRGAVSSFASSQIGQFAAPAAIAGAAIAGAREVIALSDSYTTLTNRLRAVTSTESEAVYVRGQLLEISNRTRIATDATATVYQRMAAAGNVLGKSQSELLQFTESLNKAVKLSGATAAEAQAGMIQLAQGLGAGALRGDELRSVLEQLPTVADIIAKQLGVTRGQLRSMGEQGKISAEVVFEAFKNAREELDQRFSKSVVTVSDLMQVLRNRVEATVGQLVEQSGLIPAIAEGFDALGPMIERSAAGLAVFVKLMAELASTSAKTLDVLGNFSGVDAIFGKGTAKDFIVETITPFSGFKNFEALTQGSEKLTDAYGRAKTQLEAEAEKKRALEKLLRDQFLASKEGDDFTRNLRRGYSTLVGLRETIVDLADGKENSHGAGRAAGAALRSRAAAARDFADALAEAQGTAGGIVERWAEKLDPATEAVGNWRAALNAAARVEAETLAQKLERQRKVFDDVYGAGIAYQQMLEAARAELDRGAISVDQFNGYAEKLRIDTFGGSTILAQMTAEAAEATEAVDMLTDALGNQLGQALNDSLTAIVAWVGGAQVSIGEMVRSMLADLAVLMLKLLAFQALKAAVGGTIDPGGIASGIAGALGFGGSRAGGGSFIAPNTGGGVDSVPVFARVSPGERVTFTPPGQNAPGQSQPGPISIAPIIVQDQQAAVAAYLRTPAGTRAVISIASDNPSAFRSALGVR